MDAKTLLGLGAIGGAIYLATSKKAQAKVKKTTGLSSKVIRVRGNGDKLRKIKLKIHAKENYITPIPKKWIKKLEKEEVSIRVKNPLQKIVNQFWHKNNFEKLLNELPDRTPEERSTIVRLNRKDKLYNWLNSNGYYLEAVDSKGRNFGKFDDFMWKKDQILFGSKKEKMERLREQNKGKKYMQDLTTGRRFIG